jgi:hypothetical protein
MIKGSQFNNPTMPEPRIGVNYAHFSLFQVFFTAINNVEDPSGILQPYAVWDITQNLQLTGGLSVSYGAKDTEFGGFTLPGTDIRSKSPDNAYLWLIYYF